MSLWRRVYAERRRVLLPILVLLAGNVAVLALGVLPLTRSVRSAEVASLDARTDLAAARRLEREVKAQRDGKERAMVELQKFYAEILPKSFPQAVDVANFWLEKVASRSGVMFRSGQWEQEDVRDSRLVQYTGKVTLTGDYAEIRRFLYEVETAPEFVIIESVELAQANTTQPGSVIEVSLTVSTYFLNPQAEARPK